MTDSPTTHQHVRLTFPPGPATEPVIYEIVTRFDGDTWRTIYTVEIAGVVYVLHVFQKKSTKGIKTPQREILLIKQRLREARADGDSNG